MATRIIDHIDTLRAKPEHVRHRIALAASLGITALVAVGWLIAVATSGTLALKSDDALASTPGQAGADVAQTVADTKSNFSQLLGAAGAAFGATSTAPSLTIVETRASSTLDRPNPATQTAIPF